MTAYEHQSRDRASAEPPRFDARVTHLVPRPLARLSRRRRAHHGLDGSDRRSGARRAARALRRARRSSASSRRGRDDRPRAAGARARRGGRRQDGARPPLLRRAARRPCPLGRLRPALHAAPARPLPRHRAPAGGELGRVAASRPAAVRACRRAHAQSWRAWAAHRRARGRALGRRGDPRRPPDRHPPYRARSPCSWSRPIVTTRSIAAIRSGVLLGELTAGRRGRRGSPSTPLPGRGRHARGRARRRRRRPVPEDRRELVLRHARRSPPGETSSRRRCETRCSRGPPG